MCTSFYLTLFFLSQQRERLCLLPISILACSSLSLCLFHIHVARSEISIEEEEESTSGRKSAACKFSGTGGDFSIRTKGDPRRLTNCERPCCDRWISALPGASIRLSVCTNAHMSAPSVRGLETSPTANFLGQPQNRRNNNHPARSTGALKCANNDP